LHKFKQEETVGLQKQFVYGMLSSLSDEDGYLRCFKVSENLFLCRDGLSNVLQLSHRKKQSIVPSSKLIGKRYRLVCLSEIFQLFGFVSYVVASAMLDQFQESIRRDSQMVITYFRGCHQES
jgi:hypothetical protein